MGKVDGEARIITGSSIGFCLNKSYGSLLRCGLRRRRVLLGRRRAVAVLARGVARPRSEDVADAVCLLRGRHNLLRYHASVRGECVLI